MSAVSAMVGVPTSDTEKKTDKVNLKLCYPTNMRSNNFYVFYTPVNLHITYQ